MEFLAPSRTATPSPPPTYSITAAIVSWTVILLCVLTVGFINWSNSRMPARANAVDEIQMRISGKVAVGEFAAFDSPRLKSPATIQRVIASISTLAVGLTEKIRLAVVIGQIKGAKPALAEIDRIKAPPDDSQMRQDIQALRQIYETGAKSVSEPRRQGLIQRYGWFGRLALSYGLPNSDPMRRQVLHEAKVAFVAATSLELLGGLAALIGLVLLILAIVQLATGRLHRCYRPAPFRSSAFLESFALYLGGYVVIGLLARGLAPHSPFLGTIISIAWIPLAMLWPLLRGIGWNQLRGALGWYLGAGFFREAGAGIVGYMAGLPLMVVAVFITALLNQWSGATTAHPIMFADTKSVWHVVELYLLACVFAPLVEETMFRGALFNHLRQWHGWLISAAGSALIFASLHPQGWTAIPVLGCIGFTLAGIREWRGTFVASATAHALNNAAVMTLLIVALR